MRSGRALSAVILLLALPGTARGAITFAPGANTVTAPNLVLDFGDGTGNVERVDSVRWRASNGTLGTNLVAAGGGGPSCSPGEPLEAWGQSYGDSNPSPVLVAAGSTGTWTQRGGRTVEISSSEPKSCFNGSVVTPIRTRYSFYEAPGAVNKVRVERRAAFTAITPIYSNTQGLRAYVARMPGIYTELIHPNSAGSALVSESACPDGCVSANWNNTWIAVNESQSNAGVIILRDPASTAPAKLIFDYDSFSGSTNSGITLTQPAGGWTSPVTEAEYLCFYDATSWPPASRTPTALPPGCTAAPVPVNTAVPTIAGTARRDSLLTASPGTWDLQAGAFAYQWARCASGVCTPISSGTSQTYRATEDDVGRKLRVTVTATATGGEKDAAVSAMTADVAQAPPVNTTPPSITGSVAPGQTLTAVEGGWIGAPSSYKYAWRRCPSSPDSCSDVPGATARTLVLGGADAGQRFRVRVVAHNAAGDSAPAESGATAIIAAGKAAPSNLEAPAIIASRDPIHAGDEIEVNRGRWDGSPTSFRFQWRRCDGFGANCADIPDATAERFAVTALDVHRTLRARVIAVGDGGTSAPADSGATGPIQVAGLLQARLTVTPNPTCASVLTTFDARQSTGGPYGIRDYGFVYTGHSYSGVNDREHATPILRTIAWGRNPVATGRIQDGPAIALIPPIGPTAPTLLWAYDPIDVTLIVTDNAGDTSSDRQRVTFAQRDDNDSLAKCPKGAPVEAWRPPVKDVAKTVAVSGTAIKATVPCADAIRCTGGLSYAGFTTAKAAKARRTLLATATFAIEPGARKVIRARLNKAGKRALRGHRRVRALLGITVRDARGKVVTRTSRVTLRRARG